MKFSTFIESKVNIALYNIHGQLVRSINHEGELNQKQEIDLNNLAEGLYLLRIVNNKGEVLKTKRIVIK